MTSDPQTPATGDQAPAAGQSGIARSKIEQPRSKLERLLSYRTLWVLTIVIFALDQFTKRLITARLPLGSFGPTGITVFPGFINLVHVGNTGAAWSMFSGQSTILGVLAIGTLCSIFVWRRQLGLQSISAQVAFGLLCGGILGNLLDRFLHKYVVDFIDVHFGNYIYPTFNVADSAICVGVFWYVLWSIRQPVTSGSGK